MADEFARMVPGKKLKPSARLWNDLVDLARERRAQRLSQGEIDLAVEDVLWVRNSGEEALPQYAVVGLGEPTVKPAEDNAEWQKRHSFQSAAPNAGETFAIVQVPLESGVVGQAKTFGLSKCLIDVADTTHEYAAPDDDDYDKLTSQADSGPARIYFLDVPEDTALDGGIDDAVTELTVASSTGWPAVPFVATIDDEDLLVTEVDGETWTVTRGHGATDADTHADEAVVEFNSGVVQAAVLLDQNNTVGGITSINGDDAPEQNIGIGNIGEDVSISPTVAIGTEYNEWNETTTYQVGWIVKVDDALFRCILANTNQEPPNATYWAAIASDGNHWINIPNAAAEGWHGSAGMDDIEKDRRGLISTGNQIVKGKKGNDDSYYAQRVFTPNGIFSTDYEDEEFGTGLDRDDPWQGIGVPAGLAVHPGLAFFPQGDFGTGQHTSSVALVGSEAADHALLPGYSGPDYPIVGISFRVGFPLGNIPLFLYRLGTYTGCAGQSISPRFFYQTGFDGSSNATYAQGYTGTANGVTWVGGHRCGTDPLTAEPSDADKGDITVSDDGETWEINAGAVDLTTDVSGTLPVANGGTGATSLTSGKILHGNGTSAIGVADDTRIVSEKLEQKIGSDRWIVPSLGSF